MKTACRHRSCALSSTKTVIRIRKGQPIEVDAQIIRWRKRRRKEAALKKARSEALSAILSHFKGDQEAGKAWMKEAALGPHKSSPWQLLRNGKTKAILQELDRLGKDSRP